MLSQPRMRDALCGGCEEAGGQGDQEGRVKVGSRGCEAER